MILKGALKTRTLNTSKTPKTPKTLKLWGAPKLRPAGCQCDCELSPGDKNFEATFSVFDWHSRKLVSFSLEKNCVCARNLPLISSNFLTSTEII